MIEMIIRVVRNLLAISIVLIEAIISITSVALIEAVTVIEPVMCRGVRLRAAHSKQSDRDLSNLIFLRSSSVSGDLRDRCCAELSDRRVCGTRRSFVLASPPKRHGSPSVVEPVRDRRRVRLRVVSAMPPRRKGTNPLIRFAQPDICHRRQIAESAAVLRPLGKASDENTVEQIDCEREWTHSVR